MCTKEEKSRLIIDECLELHRKGLKAANRTLTMNLFFIVTFYSLGFIVALYNTLSFTGKVFQLESLEENRGMVILTFGYVVYSFRLLFTLCYLNALSHRVSLKVKELEEVLLEVELLSTNRSNFDRVMETLRSFKGFNCYGFFTLGRPHLTSITTTFFTYIIILIQFKISEHL